jgi:hypothetical protein
MEVLTRRLGAPPRRDGGNTWEVPTPQYEATLSVVARLDFAIMQNVNPSRAGESRSPAWTPELTDRVVEGMRACRWFLATGFAPPPRFGAWLRKNLENAELQLGSPVEDFYSRAVWYAAQEVDRLGKDWQPEWSL